MSFQTENVTHETPFDALLDDVIVFILSFLSWIELNDVVFVSRLLARIRSNSSLNQTRVATVSCTSESLTVDKLCNKFGTWHAAFGANSNNQVCKIVGLDMLRQSPNHQLNMVNLSELKDKRDERLKSVVKLDLSTDANKQHQPKVHVHDILCLARLFGPNLVQVNISNVNTTPSVFSSISTYCTPLSVISWNDARHASLLPPMFTSRHACNLKELYLDGAQISSLYTLTQAG